MYHWIIRLLYLSFYFVQCGTRLFNSHRFKTSIQPSCTWKSMTGIAAVATILLATATSTSRRSLSAHRIILLYHCKAQKRGTLSLSSQSIRYGWIFVLLYYIEYDWILTHIIDFGGIKDATGGTRFDALLEHLEELTKIVPKTFDSYHAMKQERAAEELKLKEGALRRSIFRRVSGTCVATCCTKNLSLISFHR